MSRRSACSKGHQYSEGTFELITKFGKDCRRCLVCSDGKREAPGLVVGPDWRLELAGGCWIAWTASEGLRSEPTGFLRDVRRLVGPEVWEGIRTDGFWAKKIVYQVLAVRLGAAA